MLRQPAGLTVAFLICAAAFGKDQSLSDPQALLYASQSITALTGGAPISDVTLSGTAQTATPDEQTGTVALYAKGTGQSRIDLTTNDGTQSDVRNVTDGIPAGSWERNGGSSTPYAQHNCWTDPGWFFPALSSLTQTANPNFMFKYIGQELHGKINTQHIQIYQTLLQSPELQRLTTMDFYLDAGTLLPSAITFNAHADSNMYTDISIEVDFVSYQVIQGIQAPSRIQEIVNGTLSLDLTLTSTSFNTGLPDTLFTLQ